MALVSGILLLLMMCIGCAEVLMRSAFNAPIRGVVDIVSQFMVFIAALGISYCQRELGNVRMTAIAGKFRGALKWSMEALTLSICGAAAMGLLLGSYANLGRAWRLGGGTAELHLPTWISISAVTLALGVLCIRLAIQIVEALRLAMAGSAQSEIFGIDADLSHDTHTDTKEA
ncbi:TRAP transporter small permease [Antarctobacter sp.]|uniref:TRAP transporter small permease n=1 Tax=Antarctobacter sp. TaxID=1872577 RepID=UPI003A8D4B02